MEKDAPPASAGFSNLPEHIVEALAYLLRPGDLRALAAAVPGVFQRLLLDPDREVFWRRMVRRRGHHLAERSVLRAGTAPSLRDPAGPDPRWAMVFRRLLEVLRNLRRGRFKIYRFNCRPRDYKISSFLVCEGLRTPPHNRAQLTAEANAAMYPRVWSRATETHPLRPLLLVDWSGTHAVCIEDTMFTTEEPDVHDPTPLHFWRTAGDPGTAQCRGRNLYKRVVRTEESDNGLEVFFDNFVLRGTVLLHAPADALLAGADLLRVGEDEDVVLRTLAGLETGDLGPPRDFATFPNGFLEVLEEPGGSKDGPALAVVAHALAPTVVTVVALPEGNVVNRFLMEKVPDRIKFCYHMEHRPYFTPTTVLLFSLVPNSRHDDVAVLVATSFRRGGSAGGLAAKLALVRGPNGLRCPALDSARAGDGPEAVVFAILCDPEAATASLMAFRTDGGPPQPASRRDHPLVMRDDVPWLKLHDFDPGSSDSMENSWSSDYQLRLCHIKSMVVCLVPSRTEDKGEVHGLRYQLRSASDDADAAVRVEVAYKLQVDLTKPLAMCVAPDWLVLGHRDAVFFHNVTTGEPISAIALPQVHVTGRDNEFRGLNLLLSTDTDVLVARGQIGSFPDAFDVIKVW